MKCEKICKQCEVYRFVTETVLFIYYSWREDLGMADIMGNRCDGCEKCSFILEHALIEWSKSQ